MRILNEQILREQIEQSIMTDIQDDRVGGAAVAVMQNGNTIYQKCFSNEKMGIRVMDSTMFRLASMTKPITTVAILILVDRGLLDLDMPVAKFVPEF